LRRYGLTLPLPGISLPEHRAIIAELADLGYTDVWTGEVAGADAFTPLTLCAAWGSPSLRLGTAVVPVYTRGPAVIAQTGMALAELAPGRVVVGVGSSGRAPVTAMNGMAMDNPYKRVRDVTRFLTRVYRDGHVAGQFDTFNIEGFTLGRRAEVAPQVMVGALRPGMLRLGFREAAGSITNRLAVEDVAAVTAALGDLRPSGELVCRIFVCPTEDTDEARRVGRANLAYVLTRPQYRAFHEWLGLTDRLVAVQRYADARDWARAAQEVSDDIVDSLLVHGSPAECVKHIERYVAAGIDTPVIMLTPTPAMLSGGFKEMRRIVRALAPV
jgi:probable F420-dependent oxidoreductase